MSSWVRVGIALHLVWIAVQASADAVVPSPDVTTRVIIRESASSQSAQIGSLVPGQQLGLVGSVPNLHEVRLPNGTLGFFSKRWTQVIASGTPPILHRQVGVAKATAVERFLAKGRCVAREGLKCHRIAHEWMKRCLSK